jgi:putative colanic acid biosynthesis glycosyltransferase
LRVLQINSSLNWGSVGRIASEIGDILISQNHMSCIAYGRNRRESASLAISIGGKCEYISHLINTRLFDNHGFNSGKATLKFIEELNRIDPDLVHLHNIHGYYIHVGFLFEYLKKKGTPVVWTFHDCWPFTGHCSYFDRYNCLKWQSECNHCPNKHGYPESWLMDRSRTNYYKKRDLFTGLNNLTLVSPSHWLESHLKNSFLQQYPIMVIHNGVDIQKFKPVQSRIAREKYEIKGKYFILGVANTWDERKGLADFIQLRAHLNSDFEIMLVGLSSEQINSLPEGVKGLTRTQNIDELASLYSAADVFVNPTYVDNFPTVNLESLACGTPVVTYNT